MQVQELISICLHWLIRQLYSLGEQSCKGVGSGSKAVQKKPLKVRPGLDLGLVSTVPAVCLTLEVTSA